MHKNGQEVLFTKILEIQIKSVTFIWNLMFVCQDEMAVLQGTHPVMSSPPVFYIYYLQGPDWCLQQAEPRGNSETSSIVFWKLLWPLQCVVCSFPPLSLPVPSAALCRHILSSVRGNYDNEETDGILFMNSNLFQFYWWQVLEWILC